MTTGGVRRLPIPQKVLASGVAVVGMGTALAAVPDLPKRWKTDPNASVELSPIRQKNKGIASVMSMARVRDFCRRIGRGKTPKLRVNPLLVMLIEQPRSARAFREHRRWLDNR